MKTVAFILALAMLSGLASGYDLTLRDGTVLKDIRLREKTDLGIRVLFQDGARFVDYSMIPVPDLYTWGFEEARYKQAKANEETAKTGKAATQVQHAPMNTRPERVYKPVVPAQEASHVTGSSGGASPDSSGRSGQCAAYTKKGYRSSRSAQPGRAYCYQHP